MKRFTPVNTQLNPSTSKQPFADAPQLNTSTTSGQQLDTPADDDQPMNTSLYVMPDEVAALNDSMRAMPHQVGALAAGGGDDVANLNDFNFNDSLQYYPLPDNSPVGVSKRIFHLCSNYSSMSLMDCRKSSSSFIQS